MHLDLDAYFVSAARTVDARLNNLPVVISSGGHRSIATAVSYEAKKRGLKVAMPLYRAKALIPDLVVVKPDFGLYTYLSTRLFEYLFEHYTNEIEVGSIDECYLDVTNLWPKYGSPRALAKAIQDDVQKVFKLPCSIGISTNKFVAKMVTSINKPRGITVVPGELFLATCGDWPLIKFYGIGQATADKLNAHGYYLIKDLAKAKIEDLKPIVGIYAASYIAQANGNGATEIMSAHNELKGIGNEQTFQDGDKVERHDILNVLAHLAELVAQRMKNRNMLGQVIAIAVKTSGGKEVKATRLQKTLPRAIYKYEEILREATALFDKLWDEGALKFIGIRMGRLSSMYDSTYQAGLFDAASSKTKAASIIEMANLKLKTKALVTGTELAKEQVKKQHQSRYIESDRILKHYNVKDE